MFKRRIQRFIVWSSRPPLLSLYTALYRLIIRIAVNVFARYSDVLSIYLCRGCAKNEIVPGISDIDFAIFVKDDSTQIESIRSSFARLSSATAKLIDFYPNLVKTRTQLEQDWSAAPQWQFRYLEGQSNWKLLYGEDILASLAPLSQQQQRSSCVAEINRWWIVFAQLMLNTSRYHGDDVMRNSTCYKCITELANALHGLKHGEYRYSRASGLQGIEASLAARLSSLLKKRFLAPDNGLMDETFHFLQQSITELWNDFRRNPYLYIYAPVSQRLDATGSQLNTAEQRYVEALTKFLAARPEFQYRSLHTIRSAFWDFDDLLVLIDLDENPLPLVADIARLTAHHQEIRRQQSCSVFLFLRIGPIAFPITPQVPRDLYRAVLTPATMPDVFLQLGEPEVYWTDYTQWYLCDRKNRQWGNACVNKKLQLDIISKSVAQGSVLYPLTASALKQHSAGLVQGVGS